MSLNHLTRRRFIVAIAALSGFAGSALNPGLLSLSQAWAQSPGEVTPEVRHTMVRMARLLYPHDALPDDVYAGVLDGVLSDIASGTAFARQLDAASAALADRSNGEWLERGSAEQIEVMRQIETTEYFGAIQAAVQAGIYNGAAFWKQVGYPGPSKDFGGYIDRGAGEIDWLPEES